MGLNLAANIQPAHAAPPPKLKVVGNKFKDPVGNSVVLRGASITDFKHVQEAYGYKFMIDLLTSQDKGWHTKILRVPVHPGSWYGGNRDDMFNRFLKPLVDYATEKGLYVIIDWHYIEDPRNHKQDTLEFWQYIAPKFASYGNVFYELFNETSVNARNGLNWSTWKQVAQPWVNAIREKGAPNVLLMCGPQYCQHMREAGSDPFYDPMFPNQPNIAYVAHVYPGYYSRGSSLTDYDYELKPVSDRFPIIITEWGWDSDMQGREVSGDFYSYGKPFKEYVDRNQMSWTTWVANKDGWFPQMFDSNWNPRPAPRYHGKFAQDWLYEKRNSDQPQGTGSKSIVLPPSSLPLRIEAGGSASFTGTGGLVWSQDQGFSGGSTADRGNISIANTDDDKLYQTERYGMSGYALNLPNGTYTVKLHFAETYSSITAKGQRVFDVNVEGKDILNLDVFAEAGGSNRALVKSVTATVTDGQLNLKFTPKVQTAIIDAIEILPSQPTIRIEAGGSASFTGTGGLVWSQDQGFSGGSTADRGNISIANTDDDKLYQTERYGMSGYALNLPNGTYTVKLHFAETYSSITAKGQRVFDVNVEGKDILNLDVFAEAGGSNRALVKSVTATVTDGQLNLKFTPKVQTAIIDAIEILP
jgi:endoglucanase